MPKRPPLPQTMSIPLRKFKSNRKLPCPLPTDEVLYDLQGGMWFVGKYLGCGGCGEIYLASPGNQRQTSSSDYVLKVELHTSGPLFTEVNFYYRVGMEKMITAWMKRTKLSFLGMPRMIASGSHVIDDAKYRFLIIEQFGDDLQKLLDRNNNVFPLKTVYTLGIKILDILEYIHAHGYVHGDIKASNLVTGLGTNRLTEVYLIDFGLVAKYESGGVHKTYKRNPKKAHNGTMNFNSRDAHIGVHSRRGDLETLGYNMLQWLCGRLPWDDSLDDPAHVNSQKDVFMRNIPLLMMKSFYPTISPNGIDDYFEYVANLEFGEKPDYEKCRNILERGIVENGFINDEKLSYVTRISSNLGKKNPVINRRRN